MNRDRDLGNSLEVEQALKHFKSSMDAWSDAALSRPRRVEEAARPHNWRPAMTWALGCLLAAGCVAITIREFGHRQQTANMAANGAAQKASAQHATAEQIATQRQKSARVVVVVKQEASATDEDLLASVDQDISQQVPTAMEPLAQLMDENGAQ